MSINQLVKKAVRLIKANPFETIASVVIVIFTGMYFGSLRALNLMEEWSDWWKKVGEVLEEVAISGPIVAGISWILAKVIPNFGSITSCIQGIGVVEWIKNCCCTSCCATCCEDESHSQRRTAYAYGENKITATDISEDIPRLEWKAGDVIQLAEGHIITSLSILPDIKRIYAMTIGDGNRIGCCCDCFRRFKR
jgi:hypothetical protein